MKVIHKLTTAVMLSVCSIGANADIWVFDINDTITLKNDVDPQKTTPVVIGQLAAQNAYIQHLDENGMEISVQLESYIKRTITSKANQRETYGNILAYGETLVREHFMDQASYDALVQTYTTFSDKVKAMQDAGEVFFESFSLVIDYILANDRAPVIMFQSFGDEIPDVLAFMQEHYPQLAINPVVGEFNAMGDLSLDGHYYTQISGRHETARGGLPVDDLFVPHSVLGLKNLYQPHDGEKYIFIREDVVQLQNKTHTHFFDDNATRFACVNYNGAKLSKEETAANFSASIHQVDTGSALLNPQYFIQKIKHIYSSK